MTTDLVRVRDELALFADLGTDPPRYSSDGPRAIFRMIRGAESLEIQFLTGQKRVVEHAVDSHQVRTHATYRALLASERFADLRQWAKNQSQSLGLLKNDYDRRIPVKGVLSNSDEARELSVEDFDDYLVSGNLVNQPLVRVMVVDGPAGIGKTRFIEFLAWLRASWFMSKRRPLVLHVQSRGRVLTYLQDLIAFSLQRLRLNVTFDQVPVLVRHGLVTLAVDGFDELADPNGYELAWGQLGELVDQVRGTGTLILAGRETFIGQERIRKSIRSLQDSDEVRTLTLEPPAPAAAKDWLQLHQPRELEFADALFESGSFALRPFFLVQLSRLVPEREFGSPQPGILLASLVDAMIDREAEKFGDAVNAVMTREERRTYVRKLLREVVRFMADDQTETIDELSLAWMAEVAAPPNLPDAALGLLKNRTSVIAFLENDDTPRYRRFSHSKLFNHFLGDEVLDSVPRGDVPKYVRRNILGADFLASFSDLMIHVALGEPARIHAFFESASSTLRTYVWNDRGPRNLGGMLVTMLPSIEDDGQLIVENLHADEALVRGTAPTARLSGVFINQFDIQGANVESMEFRDSQIVTLTADEGTYVSPSIPLPTAIQYNRSRADRSKVIAVHGEILRWLTMHGRVVDGEDEDSAEGGLITKGLRRHPMVRLLGRACRSRSFWIPEGSDSYFDRFAKDPLWPRILDLLKEHDLVRVAEIQAAGTNNKFYHIKQPMRILIEDTSDENVRSFYEAFVRAIEE